uniref:WGS project CBMG000000000 data, contig CS5907-c003634 n=1 Tax=Fusarium acuminatum CS5907 TaxID=1318461 RepID=A0A090N560_9HYPO|nr:unnamed protein product [Fusarium acuminatum CS5907]
MRFFKSIHDDDEQAFESEANGSIQNVNDKWEAEAWLIRCGWPRHLEGINPNRLRALLQPIGDDEPVLQRMWEVFEQVLDDAYNATVRECYPGINGARCMGAIQIPVAAVIMHLEAI